MSLQSTAARPAAPRLRKRWSSRLLVDWHLLSLDAPTVAAVWMYAISSLFGLRLPWTEIAAMFTAVWMLYAADRMLDGRVLNEDPQASGLEARHLFHHLHRDTFRWALIAGFVVLLPLLSRMMRLEVLLYAALGTVLAGWFTLIHKQSEALPKEIAVGVFFAFAASIPVGVRLGHAASPLWVPGIFLAIVCTLNCLFIAAWESDNGSAAASHITAQLAARALPQLTLVVVVAALLILPFVGIPARLAVAACALSAVLLAGLHRQRRFIGGTTLRALADAALLTPLLILPVQRLWLR